jgi:flagellar protein FliS
MELDMFTSVSTRATSAYKRVSIETSVDGASPHQLVSLLFGALQRHLGGARAALARGDIAVKGQEIGRAVRILDEGLKGSLNDAQGGEIAANLRNVYSYSVRCLTIANLKNDLSKLDEVIELITPIAQAWEQIKN